MEQLIFIAIIALISLVNWLIQKSNEMREQRKLERQREAQAGQETVYAPEPETYEAREAEPQVFDERDFDDEAARRLREALGLPEEAEAPRPIRRAEPPPPVVERPVILPPPIVVPPVPVVVVERPAPPWKVPPLPDEEGPEKPVLHRRARPPVAEPVRREPSQLRKLLASRGGLRDAVVLAEILGPPRSATISRI